MVTAIIKDKIVPSWAPFASRACIRKVHSVINDTIPFEVACALLEDVEKIVTILQTTSN